MIKEKERKVGEQEERKDIVRDGRVASWERCEVSRQAEPVPRRVRERGGGGWASMFTKRHASSLPKWFRVSMPPDRLLLLEIVKRGGRGRLTKVRSKTPFFLGQAMRCQVQ